MEMFCDEKTLAQRCAHGDDQARRELYVQYAERLYSLCRRYTDDDGRARDVMHDTFIKAYDKIGRYEYRGSGSLYSWMSRIAICMCMDELRIKKKAHFVDLSENIQEEEPPIDRVKEIPPEKVREFIAKLPPTQKTIFNLHLIDEVPHKEIAKLLGITERASTSLLSKARARLAGMLNNYLKENE
ncbi:MAG: sigma-70 family RNA polymerase sigma factor [Bacteroidales bacterium]|nr:sigma-70 family RNA polymerase sigma factor [Bacteroidales bacterium]